MDDKLLDDTYQQTFEGVVKNDLTIRRLKRLHTLSKLRCLASNNNLTRPVETSVTLKMLCKNFGIIIKSKTGWQIFGKFTFLPFKLWHWQDRRACFWRKKGFFLFSLLFLSKIIKLSFFVSHRTLFAKIYDWKMDFYAENCIDFFFHFYKKKFIHHLTAHYVQSPISVPKVDFSSVDRQIFGTQCANPIIAANAYLIGEKQQKTKSWSEPQAHL